MLFLGLTGGIGAGKSTVSDELARLGAEIIDADQIAREVVAPGTPGLDMLAAEFGEQIIAADGSLDRAKLASIAFASPERTAALNAITHPLIGERTLDRIAAAPEEAIVVHDMPLLLESGMQAGYHLVLVVDAPRSLRAERLVEQRGLDAQDVANRMNAQVTDEVRRAEADVLLDNSGARDELVDHVRAAWAERIVRMAHNLAHHRAVHARPEMVEHRPEWASEARRAAARVRHVLGAQARAVKHTGMTAKPGAPARDLVELTASPADGVSARRIVELLSEAGYIRDLVHRDLLRWVDPARPLEIHVAHGAEHKASLVAEAGGTSDDGVRILE